MPAPPEESEPAIVSATGVVTAALARLGRWGSSPFLTRALRGSKPACLAAANLAIGRQHPPGDDRDGSLLRPDQMQAWPVLCRGQRACGGRDCLRDLLDRGPLRPAGQVLCRQ